ncbi:MAG TPA: hypothetical protein VFX59_00175, partial [Polyangiales bacterium]|nr:hypothetical protein [Polyangiales bacterium]
GTVVATIPVGSGPQGAAASADGSRVYVPDIGSNAVSVIDTATDTVLRAIEVGAKPAGLAITPDGKLLVVAVGGTNEAVIVDIASDTITRHVPVGQAHASCITRDGRWAYVGSQVTTVPAIVAIDLTTYAATSYPVDHAPRMLACEDEIYFTSIGLDAVEVFDPDTGTLNAPITTGASPHDLRAGAKGTELVVSQTAGDLEWIDTASGTVKSRVATGKLAHWITLSADGALAYVTNEGDDNVSVVDLAKATVTATFTVGKAPRKMALRP